MNNKAVWIFAIALAVIWLSVLGQLVFLTVSR